VQPADDSGLSSRELRIESCCCCFPPFKIAFLNTQITNHCEACNLSHKSFHFCPDVDVAVDVDVDVDAKCH